MSRQKNSPEQKTALIFDSLTAELNIEVQHLRQESQESVTISSHEMFKNDSLVRACAIERETNLNVNR